MEFWFQQLKPHVDRLHTLLQDPQIGLATWSIFVDENWKAIADLWYGGVKEEPNRKTATEA